MGIARALRRRAEREQVKRLAPALYHSSVPHIKQTLVNFRDYDMEAVESLLAHELFKPWQQDRGELYLHLFRLGIIQAGEQVLAHDKAKAEAEKARAEAESKAAEQAVAETAVAKMYAAAEASVGGDAYEGTATH